MVKYNSSNNKIEDYQILNAGFNPDQPRDEKGRWSGGAGDGGSTRSGEYGSKLKTDADGYLYLEENDIPRSVSSPVLFDEKGNQLDNIDAEYRRNNPLYECQYHQAGGKRGYLKRQDPLDTLLDQLETVDPNYGVKRREQPGDGFERMYISTRKRAASKMLAYEWGIDPKSVEGTVKYGGVDMHYMWKGSTLVTSVACEDIGLSNRFDINKQYQYLKG